MINLFQCLIGRALSGRVEWLICLVAIAGVISAAAALSPTTPVAAKELDEQAAGLRGEYFDNEDFTNLKLTRTDATVDFNWGFGSPDPAISADSFSIRWTGQVTAPVSGNYVFATRSDDGVRLWLNNQLLIDNFTPHPETEDRSVAVSLVAGQSNNIRIEYFELTANAIIRLLWIKPGQTTPDVIPSGQLSTPISPNPAPTLTSLSPAVLPQNNAAFTLTVNGSDFLPGVTAQWNNSPRQTTLISSTQLSVSIPAGDLTFPGLVNVTAVNPLPGGGVSNPVVFTISGGYEADVSPRPNGSNNGTVTIADWTQLGRFSANLDTVTIGGEFQRADCAPKSSAGDGRISLTDWVQAGRYASALDPVVIASGPSVPIAPPTSEAEPESKPSSNDDPPADPFSFSFSRAIRFGGLGELKSPRMSEAGRQVYTIIGSGDSIEVVCLARGDENAFGFSLRYNPEHWQFISAGKGMDAGQATLLINGNRSSEGLIGLALALPPGGALPSGARRLVALTFRRRAGNYGRSLFPAIEFGDRPVAREVVDAKARLVPAGYQHFFYDY